MLKILLSTLVLAICLSSNNALFSSFWAPLFDPRILNYRVDAKFEPDAGKSAREEYQRKYGVRGERLIADLGSGRTSSDSVRTPSDSVRTPSDSVYRAQDDVQFYYTYPGANRIQ